jgi:nitrate reductase assembly molybdenum cofactor insertion protein NarJ
MDRTKGDRTGIAAAAEWRLIGLLLERPHRAWREEVAQLRHEVHDVALRDAADAAGSASEGDYLRLLGPGGAVSPREVTYQPFADPGQLLAALATVYDAFAFRPHAEEPIDHIAVEVAFVSYLLLKEAFATARADHEAAATTAGARQGFVESHLAALAGTFAQRLESAGPSYLLPIAQLLAMRLPAQRTGQGAPSVDAAVICGACGGADVS